MASMRRLQWREQQEVPAGCIGFGWHNERLRALKSNMLFIMPAMQQRVQQELQHRKRMKPCSLVMCGALAAGVLSLQLMLCSWWFLLQASVPLEDALWRAAEAGGLHELEYRDPQVARWTDITYTSWRSSSTAEENQQYSKRRYAWMSAQKLSARGGCIGNWRTVGRREYSKCMAAITTWFMDLFDATLGFPGEGPGDTLLGTFAHVRQMIDLQETYATPMSSDGEGEFVARPALEVAPTTPPNCAPPSPIDLLAVRQRLELSQALSRKQTCPNALAALVAPRSWRKLVQITEYCVVYATSALLQAARSSDAQLATLTSAASAPSDLLRRTLHNKVRSTVVPHRTGLVRHWQYMHMDSS